MSDDGVDGVSVDMELSCDILLVVDLLWSWKDEVKDAKCEKRRMKKLDKKLIIIFILNGQCDCCLLATK